MKNPTDSILIQAHNAITGERAQSYGPAKQGFKDVAQQWSLYFFQKYRISIPITPEDVCWMMVDLKKVRQLTNPKRDNVVDAAGYIGLIGEL